MTQPDLQALQPPIIHQDNGALTIDKKKTVIGDFSGYAFRSWITSYDACVSIVLSNKICNGSFSVLSPDK